MIVVFGSVNLDFITRVPRIPAAGETIAGPGFTLSPGGKGANQALAARRAGARVALAGAVGRDAFADLALAALAEGGVDLSAVARLDAPTGAAFVSVDPAGENAIVVAAGANAGARAASLDALDFGAGDLLLLQRETPEAENRAAARRARERGARVMLNLAPAGTPDEETLAALDVLLMNEHEAAELGRALGVAAEPEAVARMLADRRGLACVVTLGARGAVAWTGGVRRRVVSAKVDVVDTTGAGDAFAGAFAAALDRGLHIGGALHRGVAAGALTCARPGAQPALPDAGEIERLAESLAAAELRR